MMMLFMVNSLSSHCISHADYNKRKAN